MNASTFAAMVVASTLSDIYFAIGSGIAALNGPLHGGANEDALRMLQGIEGPEGVASFYRAQREAGRKIVGFGHRVYKAYDPRARILKPLARYLAREHPEARRLFETAERLEQQVVSTLGKEKSVFPNVDFYSGIVYNAMGVPCEMFTPVFAVARVAGWTARVFEYLERNRIFRPRAVYTGPFDREYVPLEDRP
jgi:citrate synthase